MSLVQLSEKNCLLTRFYQAILLLNWLAKTNTSKEETIFERAYRLYPKVGYHFSS